MKVEPRGTVRYEMVTNDGFLVEDMEYAPYEVLEQIAFEYERREKEKARNIAFCPLSETKKLWLTMSRLPL